MGMERRWGIRKPVEVEAWIEHESSRLLEGHICNISIGGLYVDTDATALRINGHVELVLAVGDASRPHLYRLPAVVVRLAKDGAGLMFDQCDVNAFRTLVVLLLERQKALTARRDASLMPASFNSNVAENGYGHAAVLSGGVSGSAA